MSEGMKPEPSPDFTIVTVDGVYFHMVNDGVALQFYRERSFPVHDKYGIHSFPNKERIILHEIRMTLETALRVSSDIQKGLTAYEEEVAERTGMKALNKAVDKLFETLHSTPEREAKTLFGKIVDMLSDLTVEGRKKTIALLDQLIQENEYRFEEIIAAHSVRVEGK
jgi:hypothetical protein